MKSGRSRTFGGNGLLTIIRDNGESYFQQLKKQIVSQIYFGKLAPGDREDLPPPSARGVLDGRPP